MILCVVLPPIRAQASRPSIVVDNDEESMLIDDPMPVFNCPGTMTCSTKLVSMPRILAVSVSSDSNRRYTHTELSAPLDFRNHLPNTIYDAGGILAHNGNHFTGVMGCGDYYIYHDGILAGPLTQPFLGILPRGYKFITASFVLNDVPNA